MAFISDEKKQSNRRTNTSVSRYVKLEEGKPTFIQVLESSAKEYFKYWLKDSTGRNVGYASPGYDTCPLTKRNMGLGKGHPDYIKPQYTYTVNVLDVTPYKVCPECEAAYYPTEAPSVCECGKGLADIKPQPLNMVRILERGRRLFEQLRTLDQGTPILDDAGDPTYDDDGNQLFNPIVRDSNGDALNITQFVVQIVRTGQMQSTVTTAVPMLHLPAVDINDYADQLYDLPQSMVTPDEVLAIVEKRVPVADIYAARQAEANADANSTVETKEDSLF